MDTVARRTRAPSARLRDDIFGGLAREHGFEPLRVEGRVPEGLRGTLYRNGPAVFDAGDAPHWFDGNGAVAAVRLEGRQAFGAVRVLHTPSADADAGRRATRYGAFRQRASRMQRLRALLGQPLIRNVANINVLPWQGRLFALYETTLPLEVDPRTLASIGETDLGGVIRGAWNAHPHYVPARNATYHIGVRMGPKVHLDVFELPEHGEARLLTSIPLPGVMEVHDFFATENHLVFMLPPLWGNPLRTVLGGSFFEGLTWRESAPTQVLIVPIDAPGRALRLDTEPLFFWHAANAYESPEGELVLDLVRYPDFSSTMDWMEALTRDRGEHPYGGSLWRARFRLDDRRIRWEERWPEPCEFPMVAPEHQGRHHRYAWMAAYGSREASSGWWDAIARVDIEGGEVLRLDPGPQRAVGEPVLVQKSEREEDVWVLAMVRDLTAHATHLAIWDGARPQDGVVARAWFDQQLPPSLHGAWVASPAIRASA